MINDRSKTFLPQIWIGRKAFSHLPSKQSIKLYMQISIMIFLLISSTFLVIVLAGNTFAPTLSAPALEDHIRVNIKYISMG